MSKIITIDTKKVPDMEALFSLFEEALGRTFGHNLDGLADALADEEDIHIHLSDIGVFQDVFGEVATEQYFGDRITPPNLPYEGRNFENMPTLAEMLLEIFEDTTTLDL